MERPREFEFPSPESLTSTFLLGRPTVMQNADMTDHLMWTRIGTQSIIQNTATRFIQKRIWKTNSKQDLKLRFKPFQSCVTNRSIAAIQTVLVLASCGSGRRIFSMPRLLFCHSHSTSFYHIPLYSPVYERVEGKGRVTSCLSLAFQDRIGAPLLC